MNCVSFVVKVIIALGILGKVLKVFLIDNNMNTTRQKIGEILVNHRIATANKMLCFGIAQANYSFGKQE
jgi:hypothetical protein